MRTYAHVGDPTTLTDEERKRWEHTCPREKTLDDEIRDTNCSSPQFKINQRRNK